MKRIVGMLLIGIFLLGALRFSDALAQETMETPVERTLEGIVISVLQEETLMTEGEKYYTQRLKVEITKGEIKGNNVEITSGDIPTAGLPKYKVGDKIVVSYIKEGDAEYFYISDYVRRDALYVIFAVFVLLVVGVGRMWGLSSIVGMVFSFGVIFKFILPQLVVGSDPILISIMGAAIIIPVTFYLSHGFNKKTHVAIAGTLITLVITGILSSAFVDATKLTGFGAEEAGFLQFELGEKINFKGLLLAGIIISLLGILDDITISQSSVVKELKEANPKLSAGELFRRGMNVGRDHISSLVNTLVLVYAGASLPLLLLFTHNAKPFAEVINSEMIADEILRTMVGSIGLILAVPITTILASWYFVRRK
jgi:uncharacterized membrane protein